jgi:hypothetical protein
MSNRSIDMRMIEIAQVSSCALMNAKAKTERQHSSIALQAGGRPSRNIKRLMSDKGLESSC